MTHTITIDPATLTALRDTHTALAQRATALSDITSGGGLSPSFGLLLNIVKPFYDNAKSSTRGALHQLTQLQLVTAQRLSAYEQAVDAHEREVIGLLNDLTGRVSGVEVPRLPSPAPAHSSGGARPSGGGGGGARPSGGGGGGGGARPLPSAEIPAPVMPAPPPPAAACPPPAEPACAEPACAVPGQPPLTDAELIEIREFLAEREAFLARVDAEAQNRFWQDMAATDVLGRSAEELRAAYDNREAIYFEDIATESDLHFRLAPTPAAAPAPTAITFH